MLFWMLILKQCSFFSSENERPNILEKVRENQIKFLKSAGKITGWPTLKFLLLFQIYRSIRPNTDSGELKIRYSRLGNKHGRRDCRHQEDYTWNQETPKILFWFFHFIYILYLFMLIFSLTIGFILFNESVLCSKQPSYDSPKQSFNFEICFYLDSRTRRGSLV